MPRRFVLQHVGAFERNRHVLRWQFVSVRIFLLHRVLTWELYWFNGSILLQPLSGWSILLVIRHVCFCAVLAGPIFGVTGDELHVMFHWIISKLQRCIGLHELCRRLVQFRSGTGKLPELPRRELLRNNGLDRPVGHVPSWPVLQRRRRLMLVVRPRHLSTCLWHRVVQRV